MILCLQMANVLPPALPSPLPCPLPPPPPLTPPSESHGGVSFVQFHKYDLIKT